MALGPVVKSALKAGIEELPEGSFKAEAVPNLLKKQGVKQEELEFAGLPELPAGEKVSKGELINWEAGRQDQFSIDTSTKDYGAYSIKNSDIYEDTYQERVYQFKGAGSADANSGDTQVLQQLVQQAQDRANAGDVAGAYADVRSIMAQFPELEEPLGKVSFKPEEALLSISPEEAASFYTANVASRYTSEHFPQIPNYLMHSRVVQGKVDNVDSYIVQEVQSDLHQAGRQQGYGELSKEAKDELEQAVYKYNYNSGEPDDVEEALDNLIDTGLKHGIQFQPEDVMPFEEQIAMAGAPISPYEKTWLKKGLEFELANAFEQGASQLAIPIKGPGVDVLHRGEGVQKWYETRVKDTVKKLAKANGYEFKEVTSGDVDYAVIKLGESAPKATLYSSAALGGFAAYSALNSGYKEDEVKAQLKEQGYEDSEIAAMMADVSAARKAKEAGYTDEQIEQWFSSQEQTPEPAGAAPLGEPTMPPEDTRAGQAYRAMLELDEMPAKDLVANLEAITPRSTSLVTEVAGFFGNQNDARLAAQAAEASRTRIKQLAKERGIDLEYTEGEWYVTTEQGKQQVTPEWWQATLESQAEFGVAVLGGIAGAKVGAAFPLTNVHPLAKLAGIAVGSIGGAVIGSFAGAELDYLRNSMEVQEELDAALALRAGINAAEASVIGDLIGLGVFKAGSSTWKGLRKAVGFVRNNTKDRAVTALREHMFITKEEAEDAVEKLARVANVPGSNEQQQIVAANMLTREGAEGFVKASSAIDPKASAAVSKAIDTRAKDLLSSTAKLSDDQIGTLLRGDLEAYKTAVKEQYDIVKSAPALSPRFNQFKFKFDELAIEPVLDRLKKNIDNKDLAFKFARQMAKVRDMKSTTNFSDLLELRSLVNEYKFNKRITNTKDFNMLNETISRIDKAIEAGAYHIMDDPKTWLKEFATAKKQYAEMKALEKNVLAKVLSRPGVSNKAVGQALAKYATSLDSTMHDVISKLPKASRAKAEGAILDELANKFTVGVGGGPRATHFPRLQEELQGITFTTPQGRTMKRAINELAEVFRNDVPLAQASGNIQIPKFQSYLTTDPVVRAKYEMASGIFNAVKNLAPSQQGRAMTLVRKTAKVLENPVNSKSIKELQDELQGVINIDKELNDIMVEATKKRAAQGDVGAPRVKLYGNGKVLSSAKVGKEHSIPLHRIATMEQVAEVAEAEGINMADKAAIDFALKQRGYMAKQLGSESVRLLPD